jgi:6-phosphogluconolactonase
MATIEVFRDPAALARGVAEQIVARGAEAIAARGRFLLTLAGGSTPKAAYETLASDDFVNRLDWSRVHVLWGDERCVPPDDARSNYRMAREALLDRVPIPPDNIRRMRGEDDPQQAAAAYEVLLRELLRDSGEVELPGTGLDLVLLGLGDDGHTASLFPGGTAVRETVRWVVAEYAAAFAMWRITLTPVAINAARNVSFAVSGPGKAARLHEVIDGPRTPDLLPAQVVEPVRGRVTWLVDEAAASRLRHQAPRR